MNRSAIGLNSSLLAAAEKKVLSVEPTKAYALLDQEVYERWLSGLDPELGNQIPETRALNAVIEEISKQVLDPVEQEIYEELYRECRSESQYLRVNGGSRQVLRRRRRKLEKKMEGVLLYVLRYRALVREFYFLASQD